MQTAGSRPDSPSTALWTDFTPPLTSLVAMRRISVQLTGVAMPRDIFRKILRLTDDLRLRPAPAWAEGTDGTSKRQARCICMTRKLIE